MEGRSKLFIVLSIEIAIVTYSNIVIIIIILIFTVLNILLLLLLLSFDPGSWYPHLLWAYVVYFIIIIIIVIILELNFGIYCIIIIVIFQKASFDELKFWHKQRILTNSWWITYTNASLIVMMSQFYVYSTLLPLFCFVLFHSLSFFLNFDAECIIIFGVFYKHLNNL